jgi:cyclic pyranopterin phosphate synthase
MVRALTRGPQRSQIGGYEPRRIERRGARLANVMNRHEPDSESTSMGGPLLTHLDAQGRARMVDVGAKPETERVAIARAFVRMDPHTAAAVVAGDAPKGDVIGTARLAAIQAAKRTDEWIPLAHSLSLSSVDVDIDVDEDAGLVSVTTTARVFARTGVEMEAMVGCAAGALCVYDMVKGMERGVVLERVELLEKRGGRSGTWRRYEQD